MESPITGGVVFLVEDVETHEFRKEKYEVHARYYVCKDTGEKFTSEEQDELLFNELYNQYRVKHGLPFPDEIKAIRERYGLNYTQITKIVGFGQNQWRHYENGDVPSEEDGGVILSLQDKKTMLSLLELHKAEFKDAEYGDLKSKILSAQVNNTTCKFFTEALKNIPSEERRQFDLSWSIADKIAEILSEKNMTQKDLAKRMHKTEAEVSRWLGGTHNFTLSTIAKISEVLGEDIIKV